MSDLVFTLPRPSQFSIRQDTVLIAEIGTTGLIHTVVASRTPYGYWINPVCISRVLIILNRLRQGFLDLDKFGPAIDFQAKHILHIKDVNRAFAKGGNTG